MHGLGVGLYIACVDYMEFGVQISVEMVANSHIKCWIKERACKSQVVSLTPHSLRLARLL